MNKILRSVVIIVVTLVILLGISFIFLTSSDTEEENIYVNEEMGFKIQLPKELIIFGEGSIDSSYLDNRSFTGRYIDFADWENGYVGRVSSEIPTGQSNTSSFFTKEDYGLSVSLEILRNTLVLVGAEIIQQKKVTVQGFGFEWPAYRLVVSHGRGPARTEHFLLVHIIKEEVVGPTTTNYITRKYILQISFEEKTPQVYREDIEKILSSFKPI